MHFIRHKLKEAVVHHRQLWVAMKRLTTEQKINFGAVAICVAMAIYPPMIVHFNGNDFSVGYHLFWNGPLIKNSNLPLSQIDFGRLVLQWIIVVAVAGGLIYWRRTRNN